MITTSHLSAHSDEPPTFPTPAVNAVEPPSPAPAAPTHPGATTAAISCVALLLSIGLSAAGVLPRLESLLDSLLVARIPGPAPSPLPTWIAWLAACLVAPSLSLAILFSPGTARKLVLLVTSSFLILCWDPVLALASLSISITPPLTTAVWAGICAIACRPRKHPHPGNPPRP